MSERTFSRGIERVIWLASLDEDFRKRLFTCREEALKDCGIPLTEVERGIFSGIPDVQIGAAIERVTVPEPARRAFLRGAVAAALALVGSAILGCESNPSTHGISPYTGGESVQIFAGHTCHFYIPSCYQHPVPLPVVIFYHGEGEDSAAAMALWRDAAEAGGFFACCPNWTGDAADIPAEAADAGAILADMRTRFSMWSNREYMGGFSTGAQVAFTSALSLDGSWAGVVSWASLLPAGLDPAAAPRTDMAVYLATGENDTLVTPGDVATLAATLGGIGFTVDTDTVAGGDHSSDIFAATDAWTWVSQFTGP